MYKIIQYLTHVARKEIETPGCKLVREVCGHNLAIKKIFVD